MRAVIEPDTWIKARAAEGMISPFVPELVREVEIEPDRPYWDATKYPALPSPIHGVSAKTLEPLTPVISYGLSSYGYDIRLSPEDFRTFRHVPGTVIDPKRFTSDNLELAQLHRSEAGDYFILPGHSYGLGVAIERLEIPDNITVICIGKSTYCRCGIIANLSPAEAGWRGHLTLEFSNSSPADARIYANEGVVQLLFLEGDPCEVTYGDRKGKYQDQSETVTIAKV